MALPYDESGAALSSETRALVEAEVKKLVTAAHERARAVLRAHEKELHALATELLDKETLTGACFIALIGVLTCFCVCC